jgi:epoxyqueuosine reductase
MSHLSDRSRETLSAAVKAAARELGFSLAGICQAASAPGAECLVDWLNAGFGGEMAYLANRLDAYTHPRYVLEGVRSLVMLGWEYRLDEPVAPLPGEGRVSRYAWGDVDYHDLLRDRLRQLAERLAELAPGCRVRGVVDTAPLLEREFAQLAGLGWVGKNTLLLNHRIGSWFFLAALLTDADLTPDDPWEADHCGSCRACLDACPTQAFPAPYVLDASRCVSYLTIELRGPVPVPLRQGLGDWLFGCDVCQEVCPWNGRAGRLRPDAAHESSSSIRDSLEESPDAALPHDAFRSRIDTNPVDLIELFETDEATWRTRFRRTPLWRAKRRGLLRNAAYILGNQRALPAVPALFRGLSDSEPLVRGACAWALGRFCPGVGVAAVAEWTEMIRPRLAERLGCEPDHGVRAELSAALGME